MVRDPSGTVRRRRALPRAAALLLVAVPALASAQHLEPKRMIDGVDPRGCAPAPIVHRAAEPRKPNADAQRFTALGFEAALAGDRRSARDVFEQAAALDPFDERIAYHLARAHEELGEREGAVREYCRYLALAPNAPDTAAVRERITRLTGEMREQPTPARRAFDEGLAAYDAGDYRHAVERFSRAIDAAPRSGEAYFDRALAHAALGNRSSAATDLRAYLKIEPAADDAAPVRQSLRALDVRTKSVPAAMFLGIVPGAGQLYTGHPWRALLVLGAFAGAIDWSQTQTLLQVPCSYPGSWPSGGSCVTTHLPHYDAGLYAAGGILVGASLLAAFEAHATHRAARTPLLEPSHRRSARFEWGAPGLAVAPSGAAAIVFPIKF
jgi:tetratricopeptide (TPR) repeat protein